MDENKLLKAIEELKKLKSEGKISNEEFAEKIEEDKKKLDELIAKSPVTVQTKEIIRTRASAVYASLPKISKRNRDKSKKKKPEEQT